MVLTTGGDGTRFYRGAPPGVGQMLGTLVVEGFTTVEVAWDAPGIWGDARARTLGCRYATVATWIGANIHQVGGVFIAQGTSGGAAQIAFGLAYYGLGEIVDLASLGGGPPFCPLCVPAPGVPMEPLLSGTPQLGYPRTAVRFFLGADEPTPEIADNARAYFEAITSTKSMQTLPGTAHDIEFTPAGQAALLGAIREAARR